MEKIQHCRHWWPVMESIDLKPSADRKNLKKQVLIYAVCREHKAHKLDCALYKWYGIRQDGSHTAQYSITEREFKRDWLPRLQTDVVAQDKDPKPTRRMQFVSQHEIMTKLPADKALRYLVEKEKITKSLFELPRGIS